MSGVVTGTQIRGNTLVGSITVPNTAATYAAGNVIGSTSLTGLEIPNATRGDNGCTVIQKVIVIDNEKLNKALTICVFNQAITAQTNNAALTLTDAEMDAALETMISVPNTGYVSFANNSAAVVTNLADPVRTAGTQNSLWLVVLAAESIVFAGTSSLKIKFGEFPD